MDCPVCITPLVVVERNKIELDYCTACNGIWFDSGELGLLASGEGIDIPYMAITAILNQNIGEKPYTCPRCPKPMEKIHLTPKSDIVLDRCPEGHGLWFDAGELEKTLMQSHALQTDSPMVSAMANLFKQTFSATQFTDMKSS